MANSQSMLAIGFTARISETAVSTNTLDTPGQIELAGTLECQSSQVQTESKGNIQAVSMK